MNDDDAMNDDDIGYLGLGWDDIWAGRVSRKVGSTKTDRDFAVIMFRDGRDDNTPQLDAPRLAYDDEWRANRLLSVLAYASALWDINRYYLLRKDGGGHGQSEGETFRRLWCAIASEEDSLIDRLVFIRDVKGCLQVCWRNDVPGVDIRHVMDAAWASRVGDGGYPYYSPDLDGVDHIALGVPSPTPALRRNGDAGEKRYTIDQLRGAWGAGYRQGQRQADGGAS